MEETIKMRAGDDWEQHWDQYADSAEENPAQRYRRKLIFSLLGIENNGTGARLLDIGSGQGDFAAEVSERLPAAEILGLELSRSGVEISKRKLPGARFEQCNLLEACEPAEEDRNWATHAVCSEVIEHVDDPCRLLRSARAYMGAGCRLVVTAPGGPMSAFDRHIGHRKHWTPRDIEILLREAGYAPERIHGAGFPFFNMYRGVVILRGKKLVDDVSAGQGRPASLPARAAMAFFRQLFRLNFDSWGWQMVATARVPIQG